MTHYNPPRSGLYYGPVIDGPLEGDWLEDDSPFVKKYVGPPHITVVYSPDALPKLFVDTVYYKYLHGYRAWAQLPPYRRSNG